MKLDQCLGMIRNVGPGPIDQAQIVDVPGQIRIEVRDEQTALTVRLECPGRWLELAALLRILSGSQIARRFSLVLLQSRFVIERVHMRRSSTHAEEDHALRFRFEVRQLRGQRIGELFFRGGLVSKPGKGHVAEAAGNRLENVASRQIEHD